MRFREIEGVSELVESYDDGDGSGVREEPSYARVEQFEVVDVFVDDEGDPCTVDRQRASAV